MFEKVVSKPLTCLVQVYGHKSAVCMHAWEAEAQVAKARSLADRWAELSRKLRLDIEIQELDDSGEYTAVEVADPEPGQGAGGVVQLRQGQQRRQAEERHRWSALRVPAEAAGHACCGRQA